MTDDERIERVVLDELAEGIRVLDGDGLGGARTEVTRMVQFATTLISMRGRFAARPDREVSAVVEIDPGGKGWRIEAGLYEYLDGEPSERLVRDLGAARMTSAEHGEAEGRRLARAGWVAVREHLRAPSD